MQAFLDSGDEGWSVSEASRFLPADIVHLLIGNDSPDKRKLLPTDMNSSLPPSETPFLDCESGSEYCNFNHSKSIGLDIGAAEEGGVSL